MAWLMAGMAAMAAPRPNVLFLFSDNQRADTLHALGNAHIATPNLDRLAEQGVAFTRAFCQGGFRGRCVCRPGLRSYRGAPCFICTSSCARQGTWPEQFGRAGYDTFVAGKWHNGSESLLRSFKSGGPLFLGGMGNPYSLPFQQLAAEHQLVAREHREEANTPWRSSPMAR